MRLLVWVALVPAAIGVIYVIDKVAGRRPWDLLVAVVVVAAVVGLDAFRHRADQPAPRSSSALIERGNR